MKTKRHSVSAEAARRDPAAAVAEWNAAVPVGTAVRYYPLAGRPEARASRTRSEAWVMGGHSAMVSIEGTAGGVSLAHLEVLS